MSSAFKTYLEKTWNDHALNSIETARDFKQNLHLVETSDDITSLAELIVHVNGHHLGEWIAGIDLLKKLKNNSLYKDKSSMNRFVAILELGNNSTTSLSQFSKEDQLMILNVTESALRNLGGIKRADAYLLEIEKLES